MINNQFGITEKNGVPVASSREISETFNKNHQHVLRDIRTALDNFEAIGQSKFGQSNFINSTYKNDQGKRQPEYLLTRDGFSYIAMGFSGKKAAEFKIAYINAFNEMESFIRNLIDAKADFPEFTDAIMAAHGEPKHYHFSNELNMINKIVTGMEARQYKEAHGLDNVSSIRPYLSHAELEAVKSLQRIDIGLIYSMPDYYERKRFLEAQFNRLRQKALSA
jgi:Rha family phage regulatory protein